MTNPSGTVRDGQDGAGQNLSAVWQGPEPTGTGWARSHLISHWPRWRPLIVMAGWLPMTCRPRPHA